MIRFDFRLVVSLAERPRHGRLVLETGSSSGIAADDG